MIPALQFIVAAIVIEAVCDIVTDSDLFAPLREGLLPDPDTERGEIVREAWGVKAFLRRYAGGLLQCFYCTSVWGGGIAAAFIPLDLGIFFPVEWFATTFALHKAALIWHEIATRILNKEPLFLSLVRLPPLPEIEEDDDG